MAPSRLGTFLRAFSFGHIRPFDRGTSDRGRAAEDPRSRYRWRGECAVDLGEQRASGVVRVLGEQHAHKASGWLEMPALDQILDPQERDRGVALSRGRQPAYDLQRV